ncbi:alpha/beta hydrolase [Halobaculum sp. CBA1158]|uniref:alpha/beta fold hydrolase n=1 Tax=Halobaculum sp. CBA1158 TaxID=2904243 RepID=UPI001F2AD628|nr:alpha/beta hydrolase [Halobaculum sp. CBA1158]UIO99768.1 alpha/beta hydrolase [Halobaculum sp. CBA1158]
MTTPPAGPLGERADRGERAGRPDRTDRNDRGDAEATTAPVSAERRVAYTEYGSPDGAPVVFLHGTPGSRLLGGLFDSVAADAGVRLLAPDRPGYGRSPPWTGRSVSDGARIVAAVLDDAGVAEADLLAFSGGAPSAFATAATRPDRVGRVEVVAGAPPPGIVDHRPAVQAVLGGLATTTPTLLRGLLGGQAWLARRLDPSFVVGQYTTGDPAEAVPERTAAIVREDFLEAFSRSRRGAVTEFRHAADGWDVDPEAVHAEVRLWHGSDDANVPIDGARRLASTLPAARLRVIDGADHLQTLLRAAPAVLRGES